MTGRQDDKPACSWHSPPTWQTSNLYQKQQQVRVNCMFRTETKESNQARVDLHSAQIQYQQGGRGAGGQLLSTREDFGGQGA